MPVLLHRTPYDRTDSFQHSGIVADPVWLARQGFAVLVQDTRGRFESGGEFDFITQEYNDSDDVINWAAAQPWSDGNVGMYGSSYLGMTVLQAVAARNPHPAQPSRAGARVRAAGCGLRRSPRHR